MTITTNQSRNEYTATTDQTIFNYTFKIFASTDLNVYVTPMGQDPNDITDLTTDFVVDSGTIGNPNGGFITFNSPVTGGSAVTIVSDIPESRTIDYQFNGDFIPDTVNNDFDKGISLTKQISGELSRSVGFPQSQQGLTGVNLTLPAPDAGKALIWNATEDALINSDDQINGIVSASEAARDAALVSETNAAADASAASASASQASTSAAQAEIFSNLGLNASDLFDFGLVTDSIISFPTDFGSVV